MEPGFYDSGINFIPREAICRDPDAYTIPYDDRPPVEKPTKYKQYVKLPIEGAIARRRARARGEEVADIRTQQWYNLMHACAVKSGPLKDVDITFREVDWQPKSRAESVKRREPVSPKTKPAVCQMTLEDSNRGFGVDEEDGDVVTVGDEQQTVFGTTKSAIKPKRSTPSLEVGWTKDPVDPFARKAPSV